MKFCNSVTQNIISIELSFLCNALRLNGIILTIIINNSNSKSIVIDDNSMHITWCVINLKKNHNSSAF